MNSTRETPVLSAATRLLVVAPHPDDETIATGVLIQQVLAAGGQVRVLLLTAGDNNPWPQRWLEKRWRIGAADRHRWGRRRHGEILAALDCLSVPAQALVSLEWPDMGLTDRLMQQTGHSLACITEVIEGFGPSLIAMPSIDDRHPDHGAAHVLLRLALAGMPPTPLLWAYLIHGTSRDDRRSEIIDAVATQAGCKATALQAHGTQLALSGWRMRRLAGSSERYLLVRPQPVASDPVLPWQPPFWLRPLLRIRVVSRQGTWSWRWRDAPLRRDQQGAYHLVGMASELPGPRFAKLSWEGRTLWIFDRWGWREV